MASLRTYLGLISINKVITFTGAVAIGVAIGFIIPRSMDIQPTSSDKPPPTVEILFGATQTADNNSSDSEDAQTSEDNGSRRTLDIEGRVIADGAFVSNGTIQLAFEDRETSDKFLYTIIPVNDHPPGTFKYSWNIEPQTLKSFRITAKYIGEYRTGNNLSVPLKGEKAIDIKPVSIFSKKILSYIRWVTIGISLILIVLFAMPCYKLVVRFLFGMTYLITFSSLIIPIGLTIYFLGNKYFISSIGSTPIGLVQGITEKDPTPQWLVNIGGVPEQSAEMPFPKIVGGVAVPFYMVLLAIFGAGINMTQRVPEIQKDYDMYLKQASTGTKPLGLGTPEANAEKSEPLETGSSPQPEAPAEKSEPAGAIPSLPIPIEIHKDLPAEVRKDLIDTYMYLLSSPFLVIAVYYLLQILSNTVPTKPILILMALATGLVSALVVRSIIDFATPNLSTKQGTDQSTQSRTG